MYRTLPSLVVIWVLFLTACGGGTPVVQTNTGCKVTAPPAGKFDPFYGKYCSAGGLPILASKAVPDQALQQAYAIIMNMTSKKPDALKALVDNGVKFAVIGANENTTDMPEYRWLKTDPNTNWDTRSRGLGATESTPLSSGGEENLLCYHDDRYAGENITVHEFAHTFLNLGIAKVDSKFVARIKTAYGEAIKKRLWWNTYADDNYEEYWAEGVQSYFNVNGEYPRGITGDALTATATALVAINHNVHEWEGDTIHNFVNTREELKQYDPALYNLLTEVLPAADWTPKCPTLLVTPTFRPTLTFVPTATSTPTRTPTSTLTFTPAPAAGGVSAPDTASGGSSGSVGGGEGFAIFSGVVQADHLSCRYGPGASYLYNYGLIKGNQVQVVGRNEAGTWVYIQFGDTLKCWVNAKFLEVAGDINSLESVYPEKAPLILFSHPKFPPPANVQAARSGDRVVITWVGYELALGDRESAESPIYLVETWTCQAGQIVFTAAGVFEEVSVITDEAGCAEPSHGQVYIAHKDGYIGPIQIPWPQ